MAFLFPYVRNPGATPAETFSEEQAEKIFRGFIASITTDYIKIKWDKYTGHLAIHVFASRHGKDDPSHPLRKAAQQLEHISFFMENWDFVSYLIFRMDSFGIQTFNYLRPLHHELLSEILALMSDVSKLVVDLAPPILPEQDWLGLDINELHRRHDSFFGYKAWWEEKWPGSTRITNTQNQYCRYIPEFTGYHWGSWTETTVELI